MRWGWVLIVLFHVSVSFAQTLADPKEIELLEHRWHAADVWERIGKTRFLWSAKVINHTEKSYQVYVYYDLIDANGFPLARNVAHRLVEPGAIAEIDGDTYIDSPLLPLVKGSRAVVKRGPPHAR
ncbi:MAG TPA: hypothetical protein VFG95_10350 [Nitrospiria bacterium]|nr:hypothetical protein [Nitrospiria bacterium]